MRMGRLEKLFVNSRSHSLRVGRHAEELLGFADPRAGQRYLDVGCGNGAAPIHIARTFSLRVTGVDVDPEQIRAATLLSDGRTDVEFLTVDGTCLPFSDGEFDFVATNKVTHHVPDWRSALAEMVRVLKPAGHLIYSDLVFPRWLVSLLRPVAGRHLGFPTTRGLNDFFESAGLSEVRSRKSPTHYEVVCRRS